MRNLNTNLFFIITVNNKQFIFLYIICSISLISIPAEVKPSFNFWAFSESISYLVLFLIKSFFWLIISFILYSMLFNSFLFLLISDSNWVWRSALLIIFSRQFFSFSSKFFSMKFIWLAISFSMSKFSLSFNTKLYFSSCLEKEFILPLDVNDLSLINSINGDDMKFKFGMLFLLFWRFLLILF